MSTLTTEQKIGYDSHVVDNTIHQPLNGIMLTNTDLNTVFDGGRYGVISSGNTNTPKAGEFSLDVLKDSANRTMQIAVFLDGTLFVRAYVSSWGSWNNSLDSKVDKVAGKALVEDAKVQSYDTHLTRGDNPHGVTAEQVGTYTTAQINTSLDSKENVSKKGVAGGYASLDSAGLVPTTQLPSYIDDVLEYTNLAGFPATGATGKIYVALDTNKAYRWSGSTYVYITSGAVDSVAGKTGAVSIVKADVGLANVDNTSDANKEVLNATRLKTARTIRVGEAEKTFDGSSNISFTFAEIGVAQSPRLIFDGSATTVWLEEQGLFKYMVLFTSSNSPLYNNHNTFLSEMIGDTVLARDAEDVIMGTSHVSNGDTYYAVFDGNDMTFSAKRQATSGGSSTAMYIKKIWIVPL